MIYKKLDEFKDNVEQYLVGAIINDDFVTVETPSGRAVIISEAEFTILCDAFRLCLAQDAELERLRKGGK